MFYDPERWPWAMRLADAWVEILRDWMYLPGARHKPWHEHALYSGAWDVFGLYQAGVKLEENCKAVPKTTRLIETVPGLRSAGFSVLRGGSRIAPHHGYDDNTLRYHLGLLVPPGRLSCVLKVGSDFSPWRQGGCVVFDDRVRHEAWNYSELDRVVLLLDFEDKWK